MGECGTGQSCVTVTSECKIVGENIGIDFIADERCQKCKGGDAEKQDFLPGEERCLTGIFALKVLKQTNQQNQQEHWCVDNHQVTDSTQSANEGSDQYDSDPDTALNRRQRCISGESKQQTHQEEGKDDVGNVMAVV